MNARALDSRKPIDKKRTKTTYTPKPGVPTIRQYYLLTSARLLAPRSLGWCGRFPLLVLFGLIWCSLVLFGPKIYFCFLVMGDHP